MKRDDDWNDFFEMVKSLFWLPFATVFELFYHDDDDDD